MCEQIAQPGNAIFSRECFDYISTGNFIKQFVHAFICVGTIELWCTWEVKRSLKKLELISVEKKKFNFPGTFMLFSFWHICTRSMTNVLTRQRIIRQPTQKLNKFILNHMKMGISFIPHSRSRVTLFLNRKPKTLSWQNFLNYSVCVKFVATSKNIEWVPT